MVEVSHLQYADDMLIFVHNYKTGLRNLKLMIRCFVLASGLSISREKSSIMRM